MSTRRVFVSVAVVAQLVATMLFGGPGPAAASCRRMVIINPQVTVGEGAGGLTLTVFSGGCAAAGEVSYMVTPGTATPSSGTIPGDFTLASGRLQWSAGDRSPRMIIAQITDDAVVEPDLEQFTVTLNSPSANVDIVGGIARGRILDNDGGSFKVVVDDQRCPSIPFFNSTPPPGQQLTASGPRYLCDLHQGNIYIVTDDLVPDDMAISWGTQDGSATSGRDYVGVADATATVKAGTDIVGVAVTLLERPPGSPSGYFTVRIGTVPAGQAADATAVFTLDAVRP